LTKVAETIIAEDSGDSLRRRIMELEKDKDALQRALDHSTEDYNIVLAGCKKHASERDQLKSVG
jgi:hypothetical protein